MFRSIALSLATLALSGCSLLFFGDDRAGNYRKTFDGGVALDSGTSDAGTTPDASPAPTYAAELVSSSFPIFLRPSQTGTASAFLKNTGTATWYLDQVTLADIGSSSGLMQTPDVHTASAVKPGDIGRFFFDVTAADSPDVSSPMRYPKHYQLERSGVPLGPDVQAMIIVDDLDAKVFANGPKLFSPTLPPRRFYFEIEKAGRTPWPSDVELLSANTPPDLWGAANQTISFSLTTTLARVLIDVPVPAIHTASAAVTARWRLFSRSAGHAFGPPAEIPGVVVKTSSCGNHVREPWGGEQCDGGPNCNPDCTSKPRHIDLATSTAGRTLLGPTPGYSHLSNVAVGDLDGDRIPEIVAADEFVGQYALTGTVPRTNPGVVHVYTSTLAEKYSFVGSYSCDDVASGPYNRVFIADVDGDGYSDLLLSTSSGLDDDETHVGACNGVFDTASGEIYIFWGGPGSTLAGLSRGQHDLYQFGAPFDARLIGPHPDSRMSLLAIADVDGDGSRELILGLPGASTAAGAIVILSLGSTSADVRRFFRSSKVDLGLVVSGCERPDPSSCSPHVLLYLAGEMPMDRLGLLGTSYTSAAVGDFSGDTRPDLLVSVVNRPWNPPSDIHGAVYGIFGPFPGVKQVRSLARNEWDARWTVIFDHERFGTSVAIGDVDGDGFGDVVLGAPNFLPGTIPVGAMEIYRGPIFPGEPYADDPQSTRAGGHIISGPGFNSLFGTTTVLQDLNGDGVPEIISAAPNLKDSMNNPIGEIDVIALPRNGPDADLDLRRSPPFLRISPNGQNGALQPAYNPNELSAVAGFGLCFGEYHTGPTQGAVHCFSATEINPR